MQLMLNKRKHSGWFLIIVDQYYTINLAKTQLPFTTGKDQKAVT